MLFISKTTIQIIFTYNIEILEKQFYSSKNHPKLRILSVLSDIWQSKINNTQHSEDSLTVSIISQF